MKSGVQWESDRTWGTSNVPQALVRGQTSRSSAKKHPKKWNFSRLIADWFKLKYLNEFYHFDLKIIFWRWCHVTIFRFNDFNQNQIKFLEIFLLNVFLIKICFRKNLKINFKNLDELFIKKSEIQFFKILILILMRVLKYISKSWKLSKNF